MKLINYVLLLLSCSLLSACSPEDNGADISPPDEAKRALGPACDASLTVQAVKFLHVADLHARFGMQDRKYEKIKHFADNHKAQQPYTLFTNAGDDYEKGSVAESLSMGAAVREATFAMKFDVRTLGNHDFSWGEQELLSFVRDPHAEVLSANTRYIGNNKQGFAAGSYVQYTLGCVKIGVFGMVSEPWNELDQQFEGDFLPQFKNQWNLVDIAQSIVTEHRDEVDIIVMLSHLGIGKDLDIAAAIDGIDIVLGGHSHQGVTIHDDINNTIVLQPEFYADGLTELDINFDLINKNIVSYTHTAHLTKEMTDFSESLASELDEIMARYAPQAHVEQTFSEYGHDKESIATITAAAAVNTLAVDAALLPPDLVWEPWSAGGISQQKLNNAYRVERQIANTPGVSAIYTASLSGESLNKLINAQPSWKFSGPEVISPTSNYVVALQKPAALNSALFFGEGSLLSQAEFASEAWQVLENYGKTRQQNCLFIDTDSKLYTCQEDRISIWSFTNAADPLSSDVGLGTLSYRDPNNTLWGADKTEFATTTDFGINPLPDGIARVMKFINTEPNQGYTVTHNGKPNGGFASQGKVSNYSLVLDLYWLEETSATWRALLQTSSSNDNDADLFANTALSNGVGISTYLGTLQPNSWHRIAFNVAASVKNGSIKMYIDGAFVGELDNIDDRWALTDMFHLFTDNNNETTEGFVNAILFMDRPLTTTEITALGGASIQMKLGG